MTSQNNLEQLIALGEGQTLEFKKRVNNELGREICAFANSSGGKILIGVADDGTIHPLSGINRLCSDVQNHAHNCEPPVPIYIDTIDRVIIGHIPASKGL